MEMQAALWGDDEATTATSPRVTKVALLMRDHAGDPPPRVAEFFAGIGLVRAALQSCGFEVVWANDIEPVKLAMYEANFPSRDFHLGDIRDVTGADVPDIELATASFPCTDLSLAGNQAGLAGSESGMFWEFARILDEMNGRRPCAVLLENVPSFGTLRNGRDLYAAISRLNQLGYTCDAFVLDARFFVPQSRPRLFVVGSQSQISQGKGFAPSPIRPRWLSDFVAARTSLNMHAFDLPVPVNTERTLSSVVQRLRPANERWWGVDRVSAFIASMSPLQRRRLDRMISSRRKSWATAYRRTRQGNAVWEIRADAISGCLRTARGGSSKQAIVEAGYGSCRIRWMTPREYARLQGAPDYRFLSVSDSQALFGFGDAVCVPAIEWVATNYLIPLLAGELDKEEDVLARVA